MSNPSDKFSGWSPIECISIDEYNTGPDPKSHPWCKFLEARGDNCHSYAPGTKEKANEDLKAFLIWKYGAALKQYFGHNRFNYYFHFQEDYALKGVLRKKCGAICGVVGDYKPSPPGSVMNFKKANAMDMNGGRKKRKQTKRGKRHSRKTRRHSK